MKKVKKVKQQTIKSLNERIYDDCKPNYLIEKETFSIYDIGNVELFSKLYKVYRDLKWKKRKPTTPIHHSILKNFEFGREDSEMYCQISKLNINEVFDFIDFIGDESYMIMNSVYDSVDEYFEKYKRLKQYKLS